MTGADGGAVLSVGPGWQWDVALSFAGAQRDYVEQVAAALKARRVRCFYDADEQIELWGKYLADELPAIYGEQAAAVVVFVSAEYAAREWTRVERRTALARAVRERREYVLPARFDDTSLPGLPSDMVTVDLRTRTPQQFAAMIADKLAALAASVASADAEGSARGARPTRPAGAVRVSEADPRRLGVHAAISVPGGPDEVLPEYVPRDVGADVRAKVTAAEERGGFVLLVGGSSVGKTRSAVEAVKELLPDWWLVHPAGPAEVAALAAAPPLRTVVWLDELQRYLDGEHGLTGGVVRALLNAPHPAVIIGTMWPDFYEAYTAMPIPGGADPHSREREVLDLSVIVRIGSAFGPAEQDRARAAGARDRRLAIALGAAGYGLTQTLAAAPQLVARWQDADPYAWAVLTAALDTARLGARAPLSAEFLRAAAPGYCTSQQQAEAPGNWLEQALTYATANLYGAAAALSPAGAGMGQVAGYTSADYLIQHASRGRRSAHVPASTWDAILSHVRDPADVARLASSAEGRLLHCYAIPLYRHAADAGHSYAASSLAGLLERRGDLDGAARILRARADAGDGQAAWQLADLLEKRGDLDGAAQILRARADAGSADAAWQLAGLLEKRGDLKGAARILRPLADAGVRHAAWQLAGLLEKRGDLKGAARILRPLADAGDGQAAWQLAGLLEKRGDLDGAARILRPLADAGQEAARRLAGLLAEAGDLDGLRTRANAGDWEAARTLAGLLAEAGDLDELRTRADVGDKAAARALAGLLAEAGDLDGLRTRADAGDWEAARTLAKLLAEAGDLDGAVQILRPLAGAGDWEAARTLAKLLAEAGDLDELRTRAGAGDWEAARTLAGLLEKRGDLDGAVQILRTQADVADVGDGDWAAAMVLADLLEKRGDLDGAAQILRTLEDAGSADAELRLVGLLAEADDLDGLRAQADAGDWEAAHVLAGLLEKHGDLDGLRARADAGDGADVLWGLVRLLIKQGRSEEAEQLRRFGLNPDGSIACK